ncbi:5-formyltetrahydrofolate cyclo-ligase [Maricaulis sp.]|uniref:5-formyltetrahydrofolate cyclo-ligase n=1 Tax=Maricaulis sp. TaxID=1486257 RepID=UPI002621062C|nr:5-formyltetrahydrofolate cyclo-ligase [Maricaulis sp.]
MTSPAAKKAMRDATRAIRAKLAVSQPGAAEALVGTFPESVLAAGGTAAGYFPLGDELSPLLLMQALAAHGWQTSLPVMRSDERGLDFHAWRPGDPLEEKRFGVQEPAAHTPGIDPFLILVPALAVDLQGGRLGYGQGYYDRALSWRAKQGPVFACGVAYDDQVLLNVPRDPWDFPLNAILTPTRFILISDE